MVGPGRQNWHQFPQIPDSHRLFITLTGSFPEAELNLPTLTGGGGHGQKTKLQNVSMTTSMSFCRQGLLFLLALKLKIKACDLPAVQGLRDTTGSRAVY